MMITGSGGFQHLLTIIKMSTLHDRAHFSNLPSPLTLRCTFIQGPSEEFNKMGLKLTSSSKINRLINKQIIL